jgi:phage shock protein E
MGKPNLNLRKYITGGRPLRRKWIIPYLFLALLLAACGSSSINGDNSQETERIVTVPGGSYREVSVNRLQEMLEDKDFTFINVHIPFEGDIPNTDLSIPYNQIENNLELLPANKEAKIVLYCRSDRMSTIAARELVELGYSNIWNVAGGMVAWERAGLPLEGN